MTEEMGLGTAEARELRERSEFIKRVTDFAQYMQKEYVDGSDGEVAMMICASDRSFSDEKAGAATIVMGGKATMTAALAEMMREERTGELFRVARMVAGEAQSASEDAGPLKRRLRTGYGMAGLTAFWTLCIVGFQVWGVANWITTVSNLLLMAFVGFQLYGLIRDQRRKLQAIEREERRDRRDRVQMGMAAFAEMMRRMAQKNDEDEED